MNLGILLALGTALLSVAVPAWSAPIAASPKAKSTATLVKPLSLIRIGDLDFGSIAVSAVAGKVTIDAFTDVRSVTGGVAASGGVPAAARFISYGTAGSLLLITRGSLPVLTRSGGTETMSVSSLTLNGAALQVITSDGTLDIRVGGTLPVAANQVEGLYTGTFDIFVNYF